MFSSPALSRSSCPAQSLRHVDKRLIHHSITVLIEFLHDAGEPTRCLIRPQQRPVLGRKDEQPFTRYSDAGMTFDPRK